MLTTGEIATLFQVSSQTIINWLDEGKMPYERIGRGPRKVLEKEVMSFIEVQKINPETLNEEILGILHRRLNPITKDNLQVTAKFTFLPDQRNDLKEFMKKVQDIADSNGIKIEIKH